MTRLKAYIREMRPEHYIKNILLLIPLFFSGQFLNMQLLLRLLLVFAGFCLISSSIYFINDVADYENDRIHPVKRMRPIASGLIPRNAALAAAALLFAVGIVAILAVSWKSAAVAFFYYLLNIAYSLRLKKIALLDVFSVAIGFVLRIYVGALAVDVVVSHWLLLTILCLSLFLAFGKRRGELLHTDPKANTREVLGDYSYQFLDKSMFSMMTLSITFYALWALDTQRERLRGEAGLLFTVPVVILALLRYMNIVEGATHADPTHVILKDKFLMVLALILAVMMGVILYI